MGAIRVYDPDQNPNTIQFFGDANQLTMQVSRMLAKGKGRAVAMDGDVHLLAGAGFPDEFFERTGGQPDGDPGDEIAQAKADLADGPREPDRVEIPGVTVEIVPAPAGRVNIVVNNETDVDYVFWTRRGSSTSDLPVPAGERVNRSYRPDEGAFVEVRLTDENGPILEELDLALMEVSAGEEPAGEAAAGEEE